MGYTKFSRNQSFERSERVLGSKATFELANVLGVLVADCRSWEKEVTMKRDETDAIWIARTLFYLQIFLYSFPLLHFQLGWNSRQVSRLSTLVMLETFRSRVYSRVVLGFL